MDMEFYLVAAKMPHVTVNTEVSREHVGEIDRDIMVVKERGRAMLNMLQFRALPKQVIIELVYFTTLWLIVFPESIGIFKVYSPCDIIFGHKLDSKIHCRMDSGEYSELRDEPFPTNSIKSRTCKCLDLVTTGNIQGN